mmetsp:Transcript_507/g.1228  ORF Transcript_507/g.1228 Transcript_507/m.1228 type:complete len:101 (+) Transcript_507:114-416(+)
MSCLEDCGNCCGLLSSVGIFFLIFLGLALDSGTTSIDFKGDRSSAARNCYIAAAIYFVFAMLSGMCLVKAKSNKQLEEAEAQRKREREQAEERDVKLPSQ